MKRMNKFFNKITDFNNIRLAFLKAIRGNRSSPSALYYCRNIDKNLFLLRQKFITLKPGWGSYKSFQVTDPKLRTISTAPFEQRVMHHAIMNIIEPVIERVLISRTYACRKGKGTHAALLYAFSRCKCNSYFLKLDVRKYFNSIDHEILKAKLRKLIKDQKVIYLLDGIIGSYETFQGRGIPIGNLTSQFFANMYLASLDHYILEKLHPGAYCRYMDDFVVWSDSKEKINKLFFDIDEYVRNNLNLTLKPPVIGKTSKGLPFLGFLVKDKGIYLLQKSKRRVKNRITEISASLYQNKITEEKAAEQVISVFAAIAMARTNNFRKLLCKRGERTRTRGSITPLV